MSSFGRLKMRSLVILFAAFSLTARPASADSRTITSECAAMVLSVGMVALGLAGMAVVNPHNAGEATTLAWGGTGLLLVGAGLIGVDEWLERRRQKSPELESPFPDERDAVTRLTISDIPKGYGILLEGRRIRTVKGSASIDFPGGADDLNVVAVVIVHCPDGKKVPLTVEIPRGVERSVSLRASLRI